MRSLIVSKPKTEFTLPPKLHQWQILGESTGGARPPQFMVDFFNYRI